MRKTPLKQSPAPAPNFAAIPAFDQAMRALVNIPKAAVDKSIADERERKARAEKAR